jgi:hypothetical protein
MPIPAVSIPAAILAGPFPTNADRTAGTFNAKAVDWANSENAMATRTREIAEAARLNALTANTAATEANTSVGDAAAQVTLAATQVTLATAQATIAVGAVATSGAVLWVSGATYAIGNLIYSPLDFQHYRRRTAGAGAIDPSMDAVNWASVVPSAFVVGDTITTARSLTVPDWLPCDGGAYVKSSYTVLAEVVGDLINQIGSKLTDPAILPVGTGTGCSWDSSGIYLAVAHATSPFVTVYERSGSTLTKLANPAILPAGTGNDCSWDSSGIYLAVAHATSPFVTVYERSGSTLTKLANPAALPAGTGAGCSWASDNYLAVAHATSPFVTIYNARTYTRATEFVMPIVPVGIGTSTFIKASA